jgi:hypothetical protein
VIEFVTIIHPSQIHVEYFHHARIIDHGSWVRYASIVLGPTSKDSELYDQWFVFLILLKKAMSSINSFMMADAIRERLRDFIDDRVMIKYINVRDASTERSIKGTVVEADALNGRFRIVQSSTSHIILPNSDLQVLSITLQKERSKSQGASRDDAFNIDDIERRPTQPSAEATASTDRSLMMEMFSRMQDFHTQQMKMIIDAQATNRSPIERPREVGADIAQYWQMGDAMRGQDSPTWRLTEGVILTRFVPERFMIVSIPHLLFKSNGTAMVRHPRGTAVGHYKAILPNCKMQFPNQMNVKLTKVGSKESASLSNPEGAPFLRAQLERAERMFLHLLTQLDGLNDDELPSSKDDWMVYLDASVAVLELYATMAIGFNKGGGQVAQAYSVAISTTGRFDPVKLWPGDDFRKTKA